MNGTNDIGILGLGLRVLLIYILLLISMRIMGKREIGQLSSLDFVVAIAAAEFATLPITDRKLPLIDSFVPLLLITTMQVTASMICLKSNRFRRFLYGKPDLLIAGGQLQMQEMRKARYNIDDLLSQLRQKDVFDVAEVDYAVLETSGQLTVLLKSEKRPVSKGDLSVVPQDKFEGMPLTLIDDGEINRKGLRDNQLTEAWLQMQLQRNHIANPRDVFYASLSNDGTVYCITRADALQTKEKMH